MLQHGVGGVARALHGGAEDAGRLLDDAREGDDVDHASLLVQAGVAKREGEGGEGLPASGGHGKGEDPGGELCGGPGGGEHLLAQGVDGRAGASGLALLERAEVALESSLQRGERRGPALVWCSPFGGFEVGRRVQTVGVDQGGEQHADEEVLCESGSCGVRLQWRRGQAGRESYCVFPGRVERRNAAGAERLVEAAGQRRAGVACAVGEPGVVAGNGEGEEFSGQVVVVDGELRAGGRVVYSGGRAPEPRLELGGELADVVQLAREAGDFVGADRSQGLGGEPACLREVVGELVPVCGGVLGGVGEEFQRDVSFSWSWGAGVSGGDRAVVLDLEGLARAGSAGFRSVPVAEKLLRARVRQVVPTCARRAEAVVGGRCQVSDERDAVQAMLGERRGRVGALARGAPSSEREDG